MAVHGLTNLFRVRVRRRLLVGHRTPSPREDAFGLHGDNFDGEIASWLKGMSFDLFDRVVWLVTGVVSMEDLTEREVLIGALSSMRHVIPFREDLNRKSAYSYQEFLKNARGFITNEETKRLGSNEASQVNNPPNNNADQLFGRPNNKRARDDSSDNADNTAGRGQNHSSNPPKDLTSMLSP
ncbi:hypothetical protein TIFTF001_032608 [Ficus carica]|uniref:Uncharacterized protein n=1 Tax=Ficus carica TaxID=3494 RepID=A0AA88J614_FICCA|nr:hypothetical protein TIFTF001_032608 [Ficus carica]